MNVAKLGHRKMVLMALTCVTLLTSAVHAATLDPQIGDLIIGFRASGAPGQSLNYEVDLGHMSNFYGAASGATIPLTALSVQDLVDVFGASWFSRADLVWGAVATAGRVSRTPDGHAPVATLWASAPDGATPWNRASSITQKSTSGTIEAMLVVGAPGTLSGATSTTNSNSGAVIDATIAGSWTAQETAPPGTSFGRWNPTIDSSADVSGGEVVAQLYEMMPGSGAGTLIGNLILTQSGLSFQAPGGGGGTRIIGLSGNLAFGNVTTGATANAALTITNTGDSTLTITNIVYPTGFSGAFSGTIAASSGTNVTVTFAPTSITNYSGNATVNSDATSGTSTIAASGAGTASPAPVIGLSGNLAFGSVTTGTTAMASLTITNSGTATLNVSSIDYPSGFSGAFSGAIAASHGTNVTVTFAPTAITNYSGNVMVNSDAASGTSTIAASGAGVGAPEAIIGVSGNLAFGNVTTGTTAMASLTVTNRGNATLNVTSIDYPAGFSGAFSGAIAASHGTNVTVNFSPTSITNYGGTVTVNSDAASGTNTLAASGAGTAVITRIINLSGDLAFGNVTTGTTAMATMTISNSGSSTLTVSSIDYPSGFTGAFSGAIAAGSSTNVTVNFAPTMAISYGGNVTVNSDATSGTSTIAASGTGTVVVDNNPPAVTITSPTNGFTTFSRFVDVTGTATDDTAVASIVITNNRSGITSATLVGTDWTATNVFLRVGTNILSAVATDTSSNSASASVTVVRLYTNMINTTLHTASVSLKLDAASPSKNSLKVTGQFNDADVTFPAAGTSEVMFGDYDASTPSNGLVSLKFKGKASSSNTLTAVQFKTKGRGFSFAAKGLTVSNADPFLVAISLDGTDFGPDSIAMGVSSNATGKFSWKYGSQLPVMDQFFLGKSKLTTTSCQLAGFVIIGTMPDPRTDQVFFGIGDFDEALPTSGWVKGSGNDYTYTRPGGSNGAIESMEIDYDSGTWSVDSKNIDLGFLSNNATTDVRLEIADFAASYRAMLIPKGTSFSY